MKTRVLGSWAILEWINGRKPADTLVAALLAEGEGGQARLLMSAINVGEVYYFLRKHHSPDLAESPKETPQPQVLSQNRPVPRTGPPALRETVRHVPTPLIPMVTASFVQFCMRPESRLPCTKPPNRAQPAQAPQNPAPSA